MTDVPGARWDRFRGLPTWFPISLGTIEKTHLHAGVLKCPKMGVARKFWMVDQKSQSKMDDFGVALF